MERIVEQVAFNIPKPPVVTRVAAYARVSSGKDTMLHSLSAQVSYYSEMIQNHPGWLYCGVYADEALTGTKENRENFQRLLEDCRMKKIDLVITKSVSRFARNTVTTLETVRELKQLGIDVFFEEQNIHTVSADGELMLTILASYAQEESLSASENQKWRVRQAFEKGELINWRFMLGYRVSNGEVRIVPEEAEIVREIFSRATAGESLSSIAADLNRRGVESIFGGTWVSSRIHEILENEKYTGNALLMKRYRNNHLDKKQVRNRGERQQYYAEETHEAIIDADTFQKAQEVLKQIAEKIAARPNPKRSVFTGLIQCEYCGMNYTRRTTRGIHFWNCRTYIKTGCDKCVSGRIREEMLYEIAKEVVGSDDYSLIDRITAKDHVLTFRLKDGTVAAREYRLKSRAESWTEEMKKVAAERASNQRRKT